MFGRFAKQITEMFGYDMVLPMNTGAEAVETSIKLARKWGYEKKGIEDGKAIVLSAAENFHGRTLGIISMSTDPSSRGGFGPYLEGVGPTYQDDGKLRYINFGEIKDLERALELYGKHVAAFLIEPIQGEAGYVHFLQSVRVYSNCSLVLSFPLKVIYPKYKHSARNTMSYSSAMRSRL